MQRLRITGHAHDVSDVLVGALTPLTPLEPTPTAWEVRDGQGLQALIYDGHAHAGRSSSGTPTVIVPSTAHLSPGDIVAIHPEGRVDTLFRPRSKNNSLFVTERCNSKCLMCSQPPRDVDDVEYHFRLNSALIPLIPHTAETIGITGGEPTLLGQRFLDLLTMLRRFLPDTEIHALTNGRALAWRALPDAIASAAGPRLTLAIPLYSDHAADHDLVVQARDAFSQTVLGLHNCAASGIRIEVRVVVHSLTAQRLYPIARFIYKNLPFAQHIAFMGLEDIGYARHNYRWLSVDPPDYVPQLQRAVEYLADFQMAVSLYNMPLCLLPQDLWPFARVSISDWKREYLAVCDGCSVRSDCGGVFGTSHHQSSYLKPVIPPS